MRFITEQTSFLRPEDFERLESSRSSSCVVDRELRLVLFNSAWERFAAENGDSRFLDRWPLGSSVVAAIVGPLRDYFERLFQRVLASRAPFVQEYECPSPRRRRKIRLFLRPLGRHGLELEHVVAREHGHFLVAPPEPVGSYVGEAGSLRQCSNCRRVRRSDGTNRWEWVARFVERRWPAVLEELCEACHTRYFADATRTEDAS